MRTRMEKKSGRSTTAWPVQYAEGYSPAIFSCVYALICRGKRERDVNYTFIKTNAMAICPRRVRGISLSPFTPTAHHGVTWLSLILAAKSISRESKRAFPKSALPKAANSSLIHTASHGKRRYLKQLLRFSPSPKVFKVFCSLWIAIWEFTLWFSALSMAK